MPDQPIDKLLKAVDEFRNRRSEIEKMVGQSIELRDALKRKETEILTATTKVILLPEYNSAVRGSQNDEARLGALRDKSEALKRELAARLNTDSEEFRAIEEGSAAAAQAVYHPPAWLGMGIFADWARALSALRPNSLFGRRLVDFLLIGLGGLLGGWLNFLQADSPQVFDTTYWSQALVFGLCAAWVGVFVVLGTENPDHLRRFAVGIVCGFAGAVVLNTAEKTVGIAGSEQVPLTKNEQIEAQLKLTLQEAVKEGSTFEHDLLDTADASGSQEIKIRQFEHTILTVVSIVSALRSPDANSEGYSISINLLNAIERWGETYPDTALDSLDRIRKEPRISAALIHLIDTHERRLHDIQRKLPPADASGVGANRTSSRSSSTSGTSALWPLPDSLAQNVQFKLEWHPEYKASITPVSYDGMSVMAESGPASVEPSPTPDYPIVGYVRLANRDRDAPEWSDILFDYEDGDITAALSGLLPGNADQIQAELKGKYLIAKTDSYLRATFPALSERGLIFSKQIGILHAGDIVQVADARPYTTAKIGFSQIWLALFPATRIHIETATGKLDNQQRALQIALKRTFGERRVDTNGSANNTIIAPSVKFNPSDEPMVSQILKIFVDQGLPAPSRMLSPDQPPGNIQLLLPSK